MQELKKQIDEYNEFIEQLCTFYRNGIKEEYKDDFIKWVVVTAGNLYVKWEIAQNPEAMDS